MRRKIVLQRQYCSLTHEEILRNAFKSFMLDIAETLVRKRRLKIREKKYRRYKSIIMSDVASNLKNNEINKLIEADYKYFAYYDSYKKNSDFKLN